MRRLALVLGLLCPLSLATCDGATDFNIPKSKDLKEGGVYVAYNLGCEQGCDQIKKGDLIQQMDGKAVSTAGDLKALIDGQPHQLEVIDADSREKKSVTIKASPKSNLPPLTDVPPFWLVGAQALDKAPEWARRRMFGHASPSIMLVSSNGGILDGRQLHGKKHLIVYWDWGDREEEAAAVDIMQVLQKAQADLNAKNIDVMFTHVRFPQGRKAPMNDSDLRKWQDKWGVEDGGQRLPHVPLYRFPNETEFNQAREIGLEGAFTVMENLSRSPAIVLLDENGIVRWHSEGIQEPIGSEIKDPEQYTIISAVEFALNEL